MGTRIIWFVIGVLSIVAGILAFANPMAATLTATLIAGWGFLLVGILQIFAVFQAPGWGGRIWAIVLAVAFIVVGISVLAEPLAGIISLTMMVGVLFLVTGISRIIMSFSLPRGGGFWLVLLSGGLAILLAVMIFSNFPQAAAVTLGVLLAVELISNGIAMLALGSLTTDNAV